MSVLIYLNPLALTTSDRSADSLSALQHGVPPSGGPEQQLVNRTSSIAHPEALTPDQIVNRKSRIVHRRPRSKASHLPPDIQLSLNAMLTSGRPYAEIIRSLSDQGYPGFNKVNLHNWKLTGYQHWLRASKPEAVK